MNGKTMCQRKENVQEALQERKSVILPPVSTNEAYVDPRVILPPVSTNEISRINRALQAARFKRTAWIEGRAEINYQKAPFWYFTCSNCHEPTDYTGILDINCHYCRVKINPSPRAFIALTILDATGKMDTLALGEEAEKLMSIQATELTEINNQSVSWARAKLGRHQILESAVVSLFCCSNSSKGFARDIFRSSRRPFFFCSNSSAFARACREQQRKG
ncbi:uncharacterized protein [Coffea arabica]